MHFDLHLTLLLCIQLLSPSLHQDIPQTRPALVSKPALLVAFHTVTCSPPGIPATGNGTFHPSIHAQDRNLQFMPVDFMS